MTNKVPTASIDTMVGQLQFKHKQLPEPVARYELICAAQYFSRACAAEVDLQLKTQDCVADYHFDHLIPECHRVTGVTVKYCGECIDPIDKCDPCPRGYELISPTHLKLYPEPGDDQDIDLCLQLEPTDDCCDLAEVFTTSLRKEIMEKASAEIMLYVDRPWSEPRQGRFHLRRAKAMRTSEGVSQSRGYDRRTCRNSGSPVI